MVVTKGAMVTGIGYVLAAATEKGHITEDMTVWENADEYIIGHYDILGNRRFAGVVKDILAADDETVSLVIRGYEWLCPGCEQYNTTSGPESSVTCEGCGRTFETTIADTR